MQFGLAMVDVRCHPDFARLMAGFERQALDDAPETIYGVWSDLTLAYSNASWARFARDNGAPQLLNEWPLGRSVRDSFGSALAPFYEHGFRQALATGEPWQHVYACPSPREQRWFSLRALPLGQEGLLVTHALVGPVVPSRDLALTSATGYRDAHGLVLQCAHCRRVRVPGSTTEWHFVPVFVQQPPPATSHGLCPICFVYHFSSCMTPQEARAVLESAYTPSAQRRPAPLAAAATPGR